MPALISIAVRDNSLQGAGMSSVAKSLYDNFRERGLKTELIIGTAHGNSEKSIISVGWTGVRFRTLPPSAMKSLVHIHGTWTPFELFAFREARKRSAIVVISPHGALERWAFEHKAMKKTLAWRLYQKRVLQSADLIAVNSEQERCRLRDLGLRPPIATICNGVDFKGFGKLASVTQRDKVVLFFSRIDPKKGLPDLIDAWRLVSDRCGYRLHIHGHGDPDYVKVIEKKVAASGCKDIALLPAVYGADRWQIFKRASIYVLPSYSENFGITVAEALAAGLPVITTRATPWSNLERERMGYVVDNDVVQLRNALAEAMSLDSVARETIRIKAQAYARQYFDWHGIAESYLKVYDWLLHPSSAVPACVELK